jgi:hypothetical protein
MATKEKYIKIIKKSLKTHCTQSSLFVESYHGIMRTIGGSTLANDYNLQAVNFNNPVIYDSFIDFIANQKLSTEQRQNIIGCIDNMPPNTRTAHNTMASLASDSSITPQFYIGKKLIPAQIDELTTNDSEEIHATILSNTTDAPPNSLSTIDQLNCAQVMGKFIIKTINDNGIDVGNPKIVMAQYQSLTDLFSDSAKFLSALSKQSTKLYPTTLASAKLA